MAIGRHGLQGKQNLYDHIGAIPFIVKGLGSRRALGLPRASYLLGVLATLCDLAKIDAPKTSEGISFKPVLMGDDEQARRLVRGLLRWGTPGDTLRKKGAGN